jgi:hypothetical protein
MARRAVQGPTAYFDIIPALEGALQNNGAVIECGTTGNAIKQIQRMNQYRILNRRMNHERRLKMDLPHGPMAGVEMKNREELFYLKSKFDVLIIRRRETKIVIEMKPSKPWLSITDLEGNPIETDIMEVFDPIKDIEIQEDIRIAERIKVEEAKLRPLVPGGTTQAPREKFDPSKSLDLTDEC